MLFFEMAVIRLERLWETTGIQAVMADITP
jgi:hypothetical protein